MPASIDIAPGMPRHRYLVFTSAGDYTNLDRWLNGPRNFDLWITYYGDQESRFRDLADYYNLRKGSKFQNLHFAYQASKTQLHHYRAILVLDDDILIDSQDINQLFEIREEFDLWILQPAFRTVGKVSWDITRLHPTSRIRFTNFVEMSCPLFRTDKLFTFLERYDPKLVGYGIDWWFLHAIGPDLEGHVAVVDEVSCLNPTDKGKGGRREIDRVQPRLQRMAVWEEIKRQHRLTIENHGQIEYSRVSKPPVAALRSTILASPELAYYGARRLARRVLRAVYPPFRRV